MANDPPFDDEFVGGEDARPQTSAILWTLRRDAHVGVCLLTVTPLSAGLSILVDGQVVVEHTFASPAEATGWANHHRADLLSQGWQQPADAPPPITPDPPQRS
jgi:hypothetical protein